MAGESAAARAESLARQSANYRRGADGEEATAKALTALAPSSWVVIHDVAWPGRKLANIDHVVVGPPGVFVIDSKNWSGRVTADLGVLRHNGYNRVRSIRSAQDAALAVSNAVQAVRPEHVLPVLCFTDPGAPDQVIDNTYICSTSTLAPLLTSRPAVLTAEGVLSVAAELRRCLPAATEPRPAAARKVARSAVRARSTPPRRDRASSEIRRLVAGLAAAGVFFVALSTGAFTAVAGVVTDLIVQQTELPDDAPSRGEDKKIDKEQKAPADKKNKDGQRQR